MQIIYDKNTNERKIIALENICENSLIIKLPNNLIISALHATKNAEIKPIFDDPLCSEIIEDEFSLLLFYVMNEIMKKEKSRFWRYFDTIINAYDLYDFGEKYWDECQDTEIIEYLKVKENDILAYLKDFNTIGEFIYNTPHYYSKEILRKAWKILQTRSFGYKLFPGTCLVPIIDIMNHGLDQKLVFAISPKKVQLNMLKRSLIELKIDPKQSGKICGLLDNGDNHYEEDLDNLENWSNYTLPAENLEMPAIPSELPKYSEIWDPEDKNVFLELYSQKEKPYFSKFLWKI